MMVPKVVKKTIIKLNMKQFPETYCEELAFPQHGVSAGTVE